MRAYCVQMEWQNENQHTNKYLIIEKASIVLNVAVSLIEIC